MEKALTSVSKLELIKGVGKPETATYTYSRYLQNEIEMEDISLEHLRLRLHF